MTDTLLAATRKGLFALRRSGGAWRIEHIAFLGDRLSLALADARDGHWYAALDLGHFGCKLQRSADRGRSWQELAVPAYGADDIVDPGDGKPPSPATLQLIWSLEAGAAGQSGRLWAGTLPGGLFRSDDGGQSWTLQRGLWDRNERMAWFGGGYDAPGIHSICIDPRDPRRLQVAISSGGIWRSEDDGASWTLVGDGLRAEYMPPERRFDPGIQDPHRMVQCRTAPERLWVQHHNGVFRSDDGGTRWQEIHNVPPSVFGFAVGVHPENPDCAWFVPAIKDEKRVPVDARLVVTRTRDAGASFDVLSRGLPQQDCYDLVYRHGLAVSADGRQLAIGSTTGGVWTSADEGDTWQALPARLPPVLALSFA